jgi:hypothetical protein
MKWLPYTGSAKGLMVEGDKTVAKTNVFTHLFLLLWGWKTVVVFQDATPNQLGLACGFKVGYRDFKGRSNLGQETVKANGFRMKIGYEDCAFFAVTSDTLQEIPLKVTLRTTKNDANWNDFPLL